jgi:hypothetical protein
VESLRAQATYLAGLGRPDFDPETFLTGAAAADGPRLGVPHAVSFELFTL